MIGFIVAGLIIGLLARLILPGRQRIGLLWTLVLGVLGSVVGGVIANLIGSGDIWELNVIGFVVAVLASVALLSVAERSGLAAGDRRERKLRQKALKRGRKLYARKPRRFVREIERGWQERAADRPRA